MKSRVFYGLTGRRLRVFNTSGWSVRKCCNRCGAWIPRSPATSQIQKRSSVLTTMKCPSMDARQHMANLRAPGLRQQLVAPLKRSAQRRVACATATKIGSLSGARPGEMPARCWICTQTGPANHWQAAGKQRSRDAHAWARCPL